MSFPAQLFRRSAVAAFAIVGAGCIAPRTGAVPDDRLSDDERVAHVLSRLTFGPRPGDVARVRALGVDQWIDDQLHPERISDTALTRVLERNLAWSTDPTRVARVDPLPASLASKPVSGPAPDSAAITARLRITAQLIAQARLGDLFVTGRVTEAQVTERQLLEVVTAFWENHFTVSIDKMPARDAIIVWDRAAIRPNALGKFRDLLGAVAHTPATLYYLDNHLSTRAGLNENYGRELLELHTLGVDGGYTQQDVIEVARAFTGWTIVRRSDSCRFVFRRDQHDTAAKLVLGHRLAAGRGIEDGEEVLDILARQRRSRAPTATSPRWFARSSRAGSSSRDAQSARRSRRRSSTSSAYGARSTLRSIRRQARPVASRRSASGSLGGRRPRGGPIALRHG